MRPDRHSCTSEVVRVLFEDLNGNLLHADEVDELSAWEIEERGIHVAEREASA